MAKTSKRYPYEPDYVVTPGEVLQETLDSLQMTQADLARRARLSRKTINLIIQGHEPLSCETSLRLERVTGVPAHFWNNLEAKYRERMVRLSAKPRPIEAEPAKGLDPV